MKKQKISLPFLFATVLIVAGLFTSCAAPTKVSGEKVYDLKYQMEAGTTFTMLSTGEVSSITDQMGTEVVADIYGDAEDIYVVLTSNKAEGLSVEMEYGDRTQSVDSSAGSNSTDYSDLIGNKVKFLLKPDGKVEGFEGFDNLPEITTSTGEELNEEAYTLGAKTTFPLLPNRPVKIGDSWTDSQTLDIPSGDNILTSVSNFTYTLIEEVEKDGIECLKIEVKGVTTLSGNFEQGGTPLTIDRETTSTGTLYFAPKLGMFVSSESESIGEGIIHVSAAGIDIPQTITSKGSVAVKFK